jgi:hypothetical protein
VESKHENLKDRLHGVIYLPKLGTKTVGIR